MSILPAPLRKLTDNWIVMALARLIVGGMFIWSSLWKIGEPVYFLKIIKQYEMFPADWHVALNLTAVVVPWIEIIAGIALILGLGLRGTAGVLFVMLIGFTGAIALRTMHEMQVEGTPFFEVAFPCGCAGVEDEIIWQKLIKNSGLILLALLIFLSDSRRYCLSALGRKSSTPPVPD